MYPSAFWHEFSLAEFQIKSFFFFRNKGDDFKDRWYQVRTLAHRNALVAGAKVSPEDVVPLPWDEEESAEVKMQPMTAKEGADIVEKYKKMGLFNVKPKLN